MNQKNKIILIIVVIILLGTGVLFFLNKNSGQSNSTAQSVSTTTNQNTNIKNGNIATTSNANLKTYRNEEWGFEFEYPDNFILKEKVFGGYYSQFNLEVFLQKKGLDSVFLLNVVLSDFVNTNFWESQENISEVIVDDVKGTKYEYEYEESVHTAVILPLGEDLKILLATGDGSKPYINELNQILASFKFLK